MKRATATGKPVGIAALHRVVMLPLALALAPSLDAQVVLDGRVSYSPPIPMVDGPEPGNAGLPIVGTQFQTEGGTNGNAQVMFQLMSILAIFPNPGEPRAEIRTITNLKTYLDTRMKANTNLLNVSTRIGKLGGREAVICRAERLGTPSRWYQSTYVFWDNDSQWMRNSLLRVSVVAERKETFDRLGRSLETVKIKQNAQ